jgi:hypothetical protein
MTDPIRAALEAAPALVGGSDLPVVHLTAPERIWLDRNPDYIDPEHTGIDRTLLVVFYAACQSEGGTADEVTLRGLRAVLAKYGTTPAPVVSDAELRELVGRLGWIAAQVADIGWSDDSDTIARAADLLAQRHPVPVPVSERLRYLQAGIEYGYQAGHNATVEACFGDSSSFAEEMAPEILAEIEVEVQP